MAGVASVISWVGLAVNAYSLYQYLFNNKSPSIEHRYTDGTLATRVDNNACMPIIYGKVKTAGNLLYTATSSDKKILYKIISLCEGQVAAIEDIRFNDLPYDYFNYGHGDDSAGGAGVRIYYGDGVQPIDSVIPGTPVEQARVVGGLKHEAYLSCWAGASAEMSGDYNVTCVVTGKIVRVFSKWYISGYSFDPDLGLYFKWTWSDNPIWCILDFLTNTNGAGVDIMELDMDSFLSAAAYCDQPPKTGGQSKRFTLNIRIDEKKPKLEWVKDMMMACQAYPTYQNGKFGVMIEQPGEVVQAFKPKHINELNIWWSKLDEIADVARIGYIEPGQEWVKIYASANATKPLRNPPYVKELDILGVTNFNQASRLAWFYLNQSTTCKMYVSFKTDRRAINRQVGDIIELQDEYITSLTEFGRNGKRFRVYQVSEMQDGSIELQCREYNPYIYGDMLGSAPPVINISKLPNPYATPPDILGFSVLEQVYYVQKDKTAVSYINATAILPQYQYYYQLRIFYQENNDAWVEVGTSISGQFKINNAKVGSTYKIKVLLENKYGIRSSGYTTDPILITGQNAPPSPVTDLKAEETTGGFILSWNPCLDPDLDGYNIYEGSSADDTYLIAKCYSGTTYNYSATRTGKFIFHVRSVDTSGNMSPPVSVSTSIIPPKPVEGFDVYQNGRDLDFRWTQNENERVKVGYEIRRGESWDLGEVIGRVTGNSYKVSYYSTAFSHKFWIKAISVYGVYSDTPSYCTIDIAALENRNYIYKQTPTAVKPYGGWGDGSRINMKVVDGGLVLQSGAMFGEQIYQIKLPEKYAARNWIDTQIIGVKDDFLTWEQATFSWDSSKAQSMWLPEGQTKNAYIAHQISRKVDIPSNVIEAFPLNRTYNSAVNSTSVIRADHIAYDTGRFFTGLNVSDLTYVAWNVNIPAVFSHSLQVTLTNGLQNSCTIAKLWGVTGALVLGYTKDANEFYLMDSKGNRMSFTMAFNTKDYLTFGISQGASMRRLFGTSYTNGVNKVAYVEQSLPPVGVFTKYSLYGTI